MQFSTVSFSGKKGNYTDDLFYFVFNHKLGKWISKTSFERKLYCLNGVVRILFVRTWCGIVGTYLNFQYCPYISFFDNDCFSAFEWFLIVFKHVSDYADAMIIEGEWFENRMSDINKHLRTKHWRLLNCHCKVIMN